MKPTFLSLLGKKTGVEARVEADAPCKPLYVLSVYLERDPGTLTDVVQCLAVRTEPELSRHRSEVVLLLRRCLWKEERALREGFVPLERYRVQRHDVLPDDSTGAGESSGAGESNF